MRARYEREFGYSRLNATARVCQDVILAKLEASNMRDQVTIKGGVLMCALSGSNRRATQDIDLDFVRYPMTDDSIRSFISALSNLDDGISVSINGKKRGCPGKTTREGEPTLRSATIAAHSTLNLTWEFMQTP